MEYGIPAALRTAANISRCKLDSGSSRFMASDTYFFLSSGCIFRMIPDDFELRSVTGAMLPFPQVIKKVDKSCSDNI